ncbi:MAG: hypothetical protein NTY38_25520 [Acidobacteria bacterium]|nr:hypothetical protein [Acidobacteriota bacterium]
MKWIAASLILFAASIPSSFAASIPDVHPSLITIAYTFERQLSSAVMTEMRKELAALLDLPGPTPEWRDVASVHGQGVSNQLVVVRFKGVCEPRLTPPWIRPQGTLGDAAVVDGVILPFAAIDCDRIRSVLGRSMTYSPGRASFLFGRALGRVLAHEIYHILAATTSHTQRGVTKPQFGCDDLLRDHLEMDNSALMAIAGRLAKAVSR